MQTAAVFLLIAISVGYAAWRIYLAMKSSESSCDTCQSCCQDCCKNPPNAKNSRKNLAEQK